VVSCQREAKSELAMITMCQMAISGLPATFIPPKTALYITIVLYYYQLPFLKCAPTQLTKTQTVCNDVGTERSAIRLTFCHSHSVLWSPTTADIFVTTVKRRRAFSIFRHPD